MRLIDIFPICEMAWDSDRPELTIEPSESAKDWLRRHGVVDGQVKIERTDKIFHLSTLQKQKMKHGNGRGFAKSITLTPQVPTLFYGASEYDGTDEHGNPKDTLEDTVTPRVSFSDSIKRAAKAINVNQTVGEFERAVAIYVPERPIEIIHPLKHPLPQFQNEQLIDYRNFLTVFDVDRTGECWALHPVKVRLVRIVSVGENLW